MCFLLVLLIHGLAFSDLTGACAPNQGEHTHTDSSYMCDEDHTLNTMIISAFQQDEAMFGGLFDGFLDKSGHHDYWLDLDSPAEEGDDVGGCTATQARAHTRLKSGLFDNSDERDHRGYWSDFDSPSEEDGDVGACTATQASEHARLKSGLFDNSDERDHRGYWSDFDSPSEEDDDVGACTATQASEHTRLKKSFTHKTERRKKLLEELCKGASWSSTAVKNLCSDQQCFNADIISLMQLGYNIRREGELFKCYGKISLHTCRPKRHVAEAMFDILKQGCISNFDLAFILQTQGYRHEGFYAFFTLNAALVVAGVHPSRTTIETRSGKDVTLDLRKAWSSVRTLSYGRAMHWLRAQKKRQHHCNIIRTLHLLQSDEILGTLELMHANWARSGVCRKQRPQVLKRLVYDILFEKKNTMVSFEDLFVACNFFNRAKFRNRVLEMALDGIPLIYDKERRSVMLAIPEPEVECPPEGTNFLTMVYDRLRKYKQVLSVSEIAYYAHTMGYWRVNNEIAGQGKAHLFSKVLQVKKFLAILGFTRFDSCAQIECQSITKLHELWLIVQKDKGVLSDDVRYYQKHCRVQVTEKDVTMLSEIKKFVDSAEYIAFLSYTEALQAQEHQWTDVERTVKDFFIDGALIESDLSKKSKPFFSKNELWKILKSLTSKRGRGRILFDLDENHFIWDANSLFQERDIVDLPLHLFSLRKKCEHFSFALLRFLVTQHGFKNIPDKMLRQIVVCLRILGFWHSGKIEATLPEKRCFFNTLVTEKNAPDSCADADIVRCAASLIHSGVVAQIWSAYLEERTQKQALPPQQKKQRLTAALVRPEQIIFDEMPALKNFFVTNNLWPTDLLDCITSEA